MKPQILSKCAEAYPMSKPNMFAIIGIAVVFGSVIGGFLMERGS